MSATVVVIGGGVAGTLTAIQLARATAAPDVVLLDRGAAVARGVAYATAADAHLLNVPAARMSAFPDDPEHFVRWARLRLDATLPADAFLPRRLFGDYMAENLTAASVRDDHRVIRVVHGAAVDVEPGARPVVSCADGTRLVADHVVVAPGNAAPANPRVECGAGFYASRRWIGNPWVPGAFDDVAADAPVLLVGSGLTMCDVALGLRERGHTGTIHVVSRHGLLPRPHADEPLASRTGPAPNHWLTIPPTAAALLRAVRAACEDGHDWHAVIDSLRAVTPRVWRRLDLRERARFLARMRPFWDVHRHRAPRAVHDRIARLRHAGVLRCHRGTIRGWTEDQGVTALLASGAIHVSHVVNCTGPDTDVRRSTDPFVQSLLHRGLIVRDALGLGVETSEEGALVDATGHASPTLSTVGTWRRAVAWESVAVPELRTQAAAVASRIVESLAGVGRYACSAACPRASTHALSASVARAVSVSSDAHANAPAAL